MPKSDQVSTRIVGNVLMNWLAFAVTLLSGFVMSPFLIRHLGDSVYGVWVLIGSLSGYLGLLDFGVTTSIVKYTAEHRARQDWDAMNRVMSGGLAIYSIAGLISLGVSVGVAFRFNNIFSTPITNNTAAAVVLLAGLNLAVTFPATVFVGFVRGHQRYDLDAAITSLTVVARSALLVILVFRGHGILAVAAVSFVFDMTRLAYLAYSAYRLNPRLRIAWEYVERPGLKRLFSYSFFAFLIVVGRQLLFFTDSIVIGLFLTTALVTYYFVANRLVMYLRLLVAEMVGVLMPRTSELGATDDQAGIEELLVISTKYMLMIALPVAGVFFIMGRTFIALWMGPGYSSSAPILSILTIAMLAHFMEMPAHTVLLGLCKHRIVALFTFSQSLANLGLSIFLVRRIGLMGVALGTMIPMIISTAVALIVYFKGFLNLSLADYLRRSCALPVVIQAPFLASLLLLFRYRPPQSLVMFFAEIGVALVPYAAAALIVCISRSERRAFFKIAESFGLRLSPRFS
ncbi:MAG TPA: oligosaccharide flippase family protein [Blastocatellia bacterium]